MRHIYSRFCRAGYRFLLFRPSCLRLLSIANNPGAMPGKAAIHFLLTIRRLFPVRGHVFRLISCQYNVLHLQKCGINSGQIPYLFPDYSALSILRDAHIFHFLQYSAFSHFLPFPLGARKYYSLKFFLLFFACSSYVAHLQLDGS